MPEEKTLEGAIKALEKALDNPRINPAKGYVRTQYKPKTEQAKDKDRNFAKAVFHNALMTYHMLGKKYPDLLKDPLPQASDPISGMQNILTKYKAETGRGNNEPTEKALVAAKNISEPQTDDLETWAVMKALPLLAEIEKAKGDKTKVEQARALQKKWAENEAKQPSHTDSEETTDLKKFMEKYCDLYKGIDIISRRTALFDANKRELIKLPTLARPYKKGRANTYYVKDLKSNWPAYSKEVNLPPLKKQKT